MTIILVIFIFIFFNPKINVTFVTFVTFLYLARFNKSCYISVTNLVTKSNSTKNHTKNVVDKKRSCSCNRFVTTCNKTFCYIYNVEKIKVIGEFSPIF